MEKALKAVAGAWAWLGEVHAVLRPCRVSAVVVVAGALLLLSPQGRELTVRLPGEGWKIVWFEACVLAWAFQSWYWSRVILDIVLASATRADRERYAGLSLAVPRALALAGNAVAALACAFTGAGWKITLATVAVGAVFHVSLVWRRRYAERLAERRRAGAHRRWEAKLLLEPEAPRASLALRFLPRELRALPLASLVVAVVSLAASALITAWVCVDAVSVGWFLGAAAVPFLGFAMMVPVWSLLVLLAREGGARRLGAARSLETQRGYPVITALVALAIVWSFIPALDNHGVRAVSRPRQAGTPLDQALARWDAQPRPASAGKATAAPKNFVVVATAGGGLRAAYWTATVLGAVQDAAPDFRRQLAGISGVSGGSLGATVFVTLLALDGVDRAKAPCRPFDGAAPGPYECAGQAVLTQDFLGPAIAGLLFPDLIQRFVPLGLPDRAKALEQSWERSWKVAGFGDAVWKDVGFRTLWNGRPLPMLLLNGTHVETGRRVITSNLDVAARPDVFRDVYDFYALVDRGKEIAPSTAAHNSARFTYVSPASTLDDGTRLVDGGYFENFGAITARELLEAAIARFGAKIRPIAILISNDPGIPPEDLPRDPPGAPARFQAEWWWPHEITSPLFALLNTRDGRGQLAASELQQLVLAKGGRLFQFRLCPDAEAPEPALGWVLSDGSEDLMRRQLRSACGNGEQLAGLVEALGGARRGGPADR